MITEPILFWSADSSLAYCIERVKKSRESERNYDKGAHICWYIYLCNAWIFVTTDVFKIFDYHYVDQNVVLFFTHLHKFSVFKWQGFHASLTIDGMTWTQYYWYVINKYHGQSLYILYCLVVPVEWLSRFVIFMFWNK